MPACTPGDVETTDIKVVCGQSTRERRSVPESVRHERFAAYGVPWEDRGQYELDHYVSLEIGGSNAAENLWPETLTDAKRKDVVENSLHRLVCSGSMTVEEAQRRIAADWTTAVPGLEQSAK